MKRILLSLVCAAGVLIGLSACTPQETSKDAIRKHFPAEQHGKAIAVAECESGLNPMATSAGGGNVGLFQINRQTWADDVQRMGYQWNQMTDPYVNAKVARMIFNEAGGSWRPWGCSRAH